MSEGRKNSMSLSLDKVSFDRLMSMVTAEQVDWFDQHYYKVGTEFYPSVTTVLNAAPKWFLANWRGDVGNAEADRIMRDAQRHGSNVHRYLNHLLKGGAIVYQGDAFGSEVIVCHDQNEYLHLLKVVEFLNIVKPRVLMSEEIFWSDEHGFAGTMDLLLDIDGGEYAVNGAKPLPLEEGVYIADLKTGKSVSNEAFWQTAAYAQALKEQTGLDVKGTLILHTQSTNQRGIEGFGVKMRNEEEVKLDFDNFLKVFEVWKISPNPSKPKIFQMPKAIKLGDQLTLINKKRIN